MKNKKLSDSERRNCPYWKHQSHHPHHKSTSPQPQPPIIGEQRWDFPTLYNSQEADRRAPSILLIGIVSWNKDWIPTLKQQPEFPSVRSSPTLQISSTNEPFSLNIYERKTQILWRKKLVMMISVMWDVWEHRLLLMRTIIDFTFPNKSDWLEKKNSEEMGKEKTSRNYKERFSVFVCLCVGIGAEQSRGEEMAVARGGRNVVVSGNCGSFGLVWLSWLYKSKCWCFFEITKQATTYQLNFI